MGVPTWTRDFVYALVPPTKNVGNVVLKQVLIYANGPRACV